MLTLRHPELIERVLGYIKDFKDTAVSAEERWENQDPEAPDAETVAKSVFIRVAGDFEGLLENLDDQSLMDFSSFLGMLHAMTRAMDGKATLELYRRAGVA